MFRLNPLALLTIIREIFKSKYCITSLYFPRETEKDMKKKIVGILVCTLFIISTFSSTANVKMKSVEENQFSDDLGVVGMGSFGGPPPDEEWNKTFGGPEDETLSSVIQTNDGGYLMTGRVKASGPSNYDIWLVKTSQNGDEQWNKTFGGAITDQNFWGQPVQQTSPDDGYIITGYTTSFGDGAGDVWLIKTDEYGNEQWNKTFGRPNWLASDIGYSVRQIQGGGYVIVGSTCSYSAGGEYDVWLIETDEYGAQVRSRTYGGPFNDEGFSIEQTTDNGFIITGITDHYTGSIFLT